MKNITWKLKWAYAVLFLAMASQCCVGCDKGQTPEPAPELEPLSVSRICMSDAGKPYLEVEGKPFPVYGAQIRVDVFRSVDKMSWEQIEDYFRTASALGVNTVEVPVPWAFIEPKKDVWDFSSVDTILGFVNKYGLKMELLWFSTNMIGDSYSWLVPTYILSEPSIRLQRNGDADFHYLYGYTYSLDMSSDFVLDRECRAVQKLFAHIREWDAANGCRRPVISCQVHNEPDALVRWRLAEKSISWRGGQMLTAREAWNMTLAPLDAVGKAVKESLYSVATRTNVISGNGVNDFPQTPGISPKDVYALDGIDFVSFDPYMPEVNRIAFEVSEYASLPGNYPLVAENRGDYANTASLMLVASALGGGYGIYDLATSKSISSGSAPPFNSEGIYNPDLSPKAHVPQVRTLLSGLLAAAEDVALTSLEDFAVFNVVDDSPRRSMAQTVCTTGARVGFRTDSAALAFVLDRGDRLVAFATADCVLTLGGGTSAMGDTISVTGGRIYDIPFVPDGKIASTVKENIGTIFK